MQDPINVMKSSVRRMRRAPERIRGVQLAFVAMLCVMVISGCDSNASGAEEEQIFHVTEGACGEVVFVESVGVDSSSAFQTIAARKEEQFGSGNFTIEAFELQVVDGDGEVPATNFYALRILDPVTGTHLHSVSEVITREGDLYHLLWCPD